MEIEYKTLRQAAIEMLARREHSLTELRLRLVKKGFHKSAIELMLQSLVAEGLQDDLRFCEVYINSRKRKGFGPLRIEMELKQRGIDSETFSMVTAKMDIDWVMCAVGVCEKRFGKIPLSNDSHEIDKCLRFLHYRGFSSEQINTVLRGEY